MLYLDPIQAAVCSFCSKVDAKTVFPYTVDNTGSLNIALALDI